MNTLFFLQLLMNIASSKADNLHPVVDTGLLSQLVSELFDDVSPDILAQMNCVELLTNLAMTDHGFDWLSTHGIFDQIEVLLDEINAESVVALLLPGMYWNIWFQLWSVFRWEHVNLLLQWKIFKIVWLAKNEKLLEFKLLLVYKLLLFFDYFFFCVIQKIYCLGGIRLKNKIDNILAVFMLLKVNPFTTCYPTNCLIVADVTVRNLNQIMKTVMTYLIITIKELVFVWWVEL